MQVINFAPNIMSAALMADRSGVTFHEDITNAVVVEITIGLEWEFLVYLCLE